VGRGEQLRKKGEKMALKFNKKWRKLAKKIGENKNEYI